MKWEHEETSKFQPYFSLFAYEKSDIICSIYSV